MFCSDGCLSLECFLPVVDLDISNCSAKSLPFWILVLLFGSFGVTQPKKNNLAAHTELNHV